MFVLAIGMWYNFGQWNIKGSIIGFVLLLLSLFLQEVSLDEKKPLGRNGLSYS